MKLLCSVSVAVMSVAPLHAQFVDTFSSNDSSNYTTYLAYNGSGSGAAAFAIDSSDQFQSTGGEGSTTAFFRNTSETLNDTDFGQSVSIDIDNVARDAAAGLSFATSLGGANYAELVVNRTDSSADVLSGLATGNLTLDFGSGPVIETVTRTGDTSFSYSLTGAGLSNGPITGTFSDVSFSGSNVYFGMEAYNGFPGSGVAGQQTEDNLTYVVPEPSAWAMMFGGLALLLFMGRAQALRRS